MALLKLRVFGTASPARSSTADASLAPALATPLQGVEAAAPETWLRISELWLQIMAVSMNWGFFKRGLRLL